MQDAGKGDQKTVPIRVMVRIRPGGGDIEHTETCVAVNNSKDQAVSYDFDHCFGPDCATHDIYKVIRAAIRGPTSRREGQGSAAGGENTLSNVAILAYGQTGSGKTFTMNGTAASPGLVPLVLQDLLSASSVRVSFIEIYNERIIDLLDNREKALRRGQGGVIIQNLVSRLIGGISEFDTLSAAALSNRKTGETALNKQSSRSHLIIRVETGDRVISLVDLAGSENNRKTGNVGLRMEESLNINRSLFVFSNVVNAIVNKERRIPYRDSKLTRLLQDSFGGSGICYLIATVVDSLESGSEAINTLNFASKSKKVLNSANTAACSGSAAPSLYDRLHSRKYIRKEDAGRCKRAANTVKDAAGGERKCRGTGDAEKQAGSADARGPVESLHAVSLKDEGGPHTAAGDSVRRQSLRSINIPEIKGKSQYNFIDGADRPGTKRAKVNTSSLLLNRSSVEMTPITKQKSYDCFLHRARDFEENNDHRAALEIYKTIQKFADSEFVVEKVAGLQRLLRKEKTKFTAFKVLEILNSGLFIEIKKLNGIGDRRAQSVVDFIAGGHFFESLSDLKMIFSDKVVSSIMECVE